MEERDIVIIGGGLAGYVAAIRASRLGRKVTLVERDTLGGTCLNCGCIPTRAMVRAVELLESAGKAKDYGIDLGPAQVNFAKLMARKDLVIRTPVGGVEFLMKANGIEVIKGRARVLSRSAVEAKLGDGTTRQVSAVNIIIATGSRPQRPTTLPERELITTDEALRLQEIPRSMVILGARTIGLTFAGIFARLGSSITVVEGSPQILPGVDREIVGILERELKRGKIQLNTETEIKSIDPVPDGEKKITLTSKGQETTLCAQYVMVADQRKTNVEGIGLEEVGVNLSNGAIAVNERMETNVPGIFAAGDVTGEPMLAHVAYAQGKTVAESIVGKSGGIDYSVMPRCIHTFPGIATVGLSEDEALVKGYRVRIGRFPFAANAVATIFGERVGTVKIVTEANSGRILGVHCIGSHSCDLISEAALAMKLGATPGDIASTLHAHPTLAEALMEAALDVTGDTIQSIPQKR